VKSVNQERRPANDGFKRNDQRAPQENRPQAPRDGFVRKGAPDFKRNPAFDKDAEGDNRFARKGGPKFEAPASGVAPDNKRKDDKRRNSQEKDKKKNSYDDRYEDGMGQKGKALKPGAFIKPEKKVEKVEDDIKVLVLPEVLTIRDLADKMKLQPSTIVKKLFLAGEIVTVNTEISFEKAEEIAMEYDILCEKEEKVDVIEELLKEDEENEENLVERPPVICVMGHVDHGKTSLLDAIRNTHVIDREAGGITQHIGAYQVKINDKNITFLDTPGHEAFTAMRMRGATSTDIAVLVVAADDGVMPQTVEAISHAKAAGVPIIVAVNKVDKIGYDFDDKVKDMTSYPQISQLMTELSTDHQLNPEAWGGDTIYVPVSAKKGLGIDDLLENILISAEILELKSNPNRKARGLVIEAKLDKGRGPVATVLVQKGTLKVGDFISAGEAHGKVRAMINDKKENVKVATPSTPVEILGLNQAPSAGDVFIAHENDKEAKHFADTFIAEHKIKKIEDTKSKMSLDDVFTKIKEDNLKSLNIIVKADVQGSVEAVKQSLEKISNEEVVVKVIHGGVGAINESDVTLASASEAIIIGFNVRIDNQAKDTADREGVDVRLYSVIYQAIEDVEAAMKGLLDPVFEEKVIGHCEVRQIFKANAIGNIAGSYVLDGLVKRGCSVRISREGEQIFEGKLASLKRFKDDVKEVKAGYECGLVFEGFNGIQELDIVEAYEMVEVPR
ncbi:MAG: translation initiation factor IF-2, partial [Lachnospiraceae bacterium]|nr:translation initiation factor IF-2 [Lachnospiraceae bacterium]